MSRIAVVGCGAMGSIYAALLASAGNDVIAVDRNADHVEAINSRGLRVTGASGERTVAIPAFLSPPERTFDLVICAVKARFAQDAAQAMQPMIGRETAVLTIQNGLGSADLVAAAVGAEHLLVGVAQGFGAALVAPGHAHHNDMKAIRIGAYQDADNPAAERVAKLWQEAGFDVQAVDNITAMQWEKLICNVAYSAPCTLAGLTVGEVLEHPQLSKVSQAAAVEAFEVAQALGVNLRFDDPVREIQEFAARMPAAKPSVLLDIEAGRRSEVDVINGAVPVQAQRAGLQAPVNAALTALVQRIEEAG